MGYISNWSDPQITRDLGGRIVLPDKPIEVVYRGGQSGTTALFYDFVQHTDPALFTQWAQRNRFPTDQPHHPARHVARVRAEDDRASRLRCHRQLRASAPKWAITYDEFGYAKNYNVEAAWIQNAAGNLVLPYAGNISAALESARLRPDLSQELSGVYASRNPDGVPDLGLQLHGDPVRAEPETADVQAARTPTPASQRRSRPGCATSPAMGSGTWRDIGYSPLPPNLSQEMANSIARMNRLDAGAAESRQLRQPTVRP